jgi:pentatricopeptide repeat protein
LELLLSLAFVTIDPIIHIFAFFIHISKGMIRKRPWTCVGLIAIGFVFPSEQYPLPIIQLPSSFDPCSRTQNVHGRRNLIESSDSICLGRWDSIQYRKKLASRNVWTLPRSDRLYLSSNDVVESDLAQVWNSTVALNQEIARLCQTQRWSEAYEMLQTAEDRSKNIKTNFTSNVPCVLPERESYSILLRAIAASVLDRETIQLAESVFRRLLSSTEQMAPTRVEFSAILLAWSKSYDRRAAERCEFLLQDHWRRYNATIENPAELFGAEELCPTHSAYVATMTAISRSGGGLRAAQRAEALLEEMERFSKTDSRLKHLKPTTTCVNIVLYVVICCDNRDLPPVGFLSCPSFAHPIFLVLRNSNAWSKSGAREAPERCKVILQRMEDLYCSGRTELQPNTISFNTVLDCLAQSRTPTAAADAEHLLGYMDQLSKDEKLYRNTCRPDIQSFNAVLNAWARSRHPMAAVRAEAILQHMHQRYAAGNVTFPPDLPSFNTVLTAWSRSKNRTLAARNTESILRRMEEDFANGCKMAVAPNTVSYNIVLSALAQSNDPRAEDRALALFERMKERHAQGIASCRPDCITYNTIIPLLCKQKTKRNVVDIAMDLLSEVENVYRNTQDAAYKPNTRLYTSVIHAMARNQEPERAEMLVAEMERRFAATGDTDLQPDCICYDALINAIGWSKQKGRSLKCYAIYQKMKRLYRSRDNVLAKPDIITCNSVLNACAFDDAKTDEERSAIMKIAVQTLEDFQRTPRFGWPNHITYANMLLCMERHVLNAKQRVALAETTFWHCCERGLVSVLILNHLFRILPFERLSELLGDALTSAPGEDLRFDWQALPSGWTRYAPRPKVRQVSRPSPKMVSLRKPKIAAQVFQNQTTASSSKPVKSSVP